MTRTVYLALFFFLPQLIQSQSLSVIDAYMRVDASANDPLYTTYASSMSRRDFRDDMAYKMDYSSDTSHIGYAGGIGGKIFCIWQIDDLFINSTGNFYKKPVVTYSFPDMAILEYQPVQGIQVKETFLVYSSQIALVDMEVKNTGFQSREVSVFPVLFFQHDSLQVLEYNKENEGLLATRMMRTPHGDENSRPVKVTEFFSGSPRVFSRGEFSTNPETFYQTLKSGFQLEENPDSLRRDTPPVSLLVLRLKKLVRPSETVSFRYMRGITRQEKDPGFLMKEVAGLKRSFLRTFFEDNLMLFLNIPKIKFENKSHKIVYLSALNLGRSSVYPASGSSRFNFYLSGNTIPGEFKDQQLLKEASGLMGYVYMDPRSAENSFRIFTEQLDLNGQLSMSERKSPAGSGQDTLKSASSLPFYNWIGMEIYRATRNKQFLKETYISGTKHVDCLIEEAFSAKEKNLDLNLLILKEERCLGWMARELGRMAESSDWLRKANLFSKFVEERMWDDSSGFYFSADKVVPSSSANTWPNYKKEISGFLPMWAGYASRERASRLVLSLSDSSQFFRKYGLPDISAKNKTKLAPLGLEEPQQRMELLLNYMVYDGLKKYGYPDLAKELALKMISCVSAQLGKNHNFWEYYSADTSSGSGILNYFPACIMAKLLYEENVK